MASVVLTNVEKVYEGGYHAVKNLNLCIADREFVVFVGPSGCGKSTTLRMVAGLEDVSSGTIEIDGRVVNHVPPKDRDIAMVFQNYALYPHMSVYENMAFGLTLRKLSKPDIDQRVRRAAEILGIVALLDRKPKALSGGQRQRVAVGRAIVRQPKCFLFDEPLSNLDAKLRVEMRVELKRLHLELKSTTIYVTHDQEEAMTLGDRVVVMREGVVQQSGPALEIYHHPVNRFVAGFLGSPPMNFLNGRIIEDGGRLFFDEGSGRLPVPDFARAALSAFKSREVVLGARPEIISDAAHARFPTGDNSLPLKVELVQPLGDRMDVHLSSAQSRLVAQMPSFAGLQAGQPFEAHFDLRKLHFFSPAADGISLVPREALPLAAE